jgi:16S rRNA (cytosine967-C5)-methyltransferase
MMGAGSGAKSPKAQPAKAPHPIRPVISAARKAAFAILMAVERGQSHSDDLLRGKGVNSLSAPDRNLATALVLGVLRWQIQLDHQLQVLLKRPNAKLDAEIRIALRLGAFQLLHMDRIPARAAIDESVELAKQAGHKFASGMVNAVLRKLGGSSFDFSEGTPAELAMAQAHPAWMVERWAKNFGLEAARALCRHGQTQPALTVRLVESADEATASDICALPPFPQEDETQVLRLRSAPLRMTGLGTVAVELAQAGIVLEPGELLSAARTVVSGDVTSTLVFKEGRVRLQDEGSQLVAEIAGKGSAILDCCAAPGGKTLILAERNPQARVVACESSAARLEQLVKRLVPLGDRVECRHADAATLTEDSLFDLALADVPCSGTGTLGRNPEIRHRLRPEEFSRQAERQRAILKAALRAVRPGGRVVYSTCSVEPEENEQVIAAVVAENSNARAVSLESRIEVMLTEGVLTPSGAERLKTSLTPQGAVRLLPGVFHTDGFFIAMVERIA